MVESAESESPEKPSLPGPREASRTHLVVIPSYNSGPLLERTVRAARAHWNPVWVVIDGSTDSSPSDVQAMAAQDQGLVVLCLPDNRGKGAAVRHGLTAAAKAGFTHALVMDADGQHPADRIGDFMTASEAAPGALIMGDPIFGPEAPWIRVVWRRMSNGCGRLAAGRRLGDTLFGFRVYPIRPLLDAMAMSRGMRGFDFDPEAVVRLAWAGTDIVRLPAQVRYLGPADDGISHFRYIRDNLLLARMYVGLGLAALGRRLGPNQR